MNVKLPIMTKYLYMFGIALSLAIGLSQWQIVTPAAAQSAVAPRVPTDGSPVEFAYALSRYRISGGVFIAASADVVRPEFRGADSNRDADSPPSLTDLLPAFRAVHGGYLADLADGVVSISGPGLSARRLIRRVVITNQPIELAFQAVAHLLDSNPDAPMGAISGSGTSTPPWLNDASPRVSLDMNAVRAGEVLNALVAKSPGSVWVITRRGVGREQTDMLRLRTADGRTIRHLAPVTVN